MTAPGPALIERNLRLYGWVKVFAMRAFLPVTTIYLVEVGHITLPQVGILATVAHLTTLAATIPAGYFADRFTRRAAMFVSSLLMAISSSIYVVFPTFAGGLAATFFVSLGYSFLSGAGEALIHDTLEIIGKPQHYIRSIGRSQSFGLIGNIVLVGLVPLTYAIDKRLPFIFGTVAALLFALVVLRMVEPARLGDPSRHHNPAIDLVRNLRRFVGRYTVVLFTAIGLVGGLYLASSNFNNLAFRDMGLSPNLIGLIFASASAVAAIGGRYLHHLRRMSLAMYATLDLLIAAGFMLAIGLTHNLWICIPAFMFYQGFWRLRKIMYQDHLLRRFPGNPNKATLISTLGFFESLNASWLPFAIVLGTGSLGFYDGYIAVRAGAVVVFALAFILGFAILRRAPRLPAAT